MAYATSRMTPKELDVLYHAAKARKVYVEKVSDWFGDDYAWTDEINAVEPDWRDVDEAGLEEFEISRRERIAERNEY